MDFFFLRNENKMRIKKNYLYILIIKKCERNDFFLILFLFITKLRQVHQLGEGRHGFIPITDVFLASVAVDGQVRETLAQRVLLARRFVEMLLHASVDVARAEDAVARHAHPVLADVAASGARRLGVEDGAFAELDDVGVGVRARLEEVNGEASARVGLDFLVFCVDRRF